MPKLKLSNGRSIELDRVDYQWARHFTWGEKPGSGAWNSRLGYLSHAIAKRMRGRPLPKGWRVFRLDRNAKANYRRSNLLPAPCGGQALVPRDPRRGVTKYAGRYRATCMVSGQHQLAKVFTRKADAWACRRAFLAKHGY